MTIQARLLLHPDDEKFVGIELDEAPIMLHVATTVQVDAGDSGEHLTNMEALGVYRLITRTWPAATDPGTPATATYVFDHLA